MQPLQRVDHLPRLPASQDGVPQLDELLDHGQAEPTRTSRQDDVLHLVARQRMYLKRIAIVKTISSYGIRHNYRRTSLTRRVSEGCPESLAYASGWCNTNPTR